MVVIFLIDLKELNKEMKKSKFVIWSEDTDQFLTDIIKGNWDESGYRAMYETGEYTPDLNNFKKNAIFPSKMEAQKGLDRYLKRHTNMKQYNDYHCIKVSQIIVKKTMVEMNSLGKLKCL